MPGWITYPERKEPERRMPVMFIPALQSRWMLMANDFRDNQKPLLEKNASLGFYCGLLSGQSAADHPSLTADLPEYVMAPYDARFLPTRKALDLAIRISVVNSGTDDVYRVASVFSVITVSQPGSLPVLPPFVMVHECRYFAFSPYILKQNWP